MNFTSQCKYALNRFLAPLNLRIETLTAEKNERERLNNLVLSGHFDRPISRVLTQFKECNPEPLLNAVKQFEPGMSCFVEKRADHYCFENDYYRSPDAEILYAMTRICSPKRIVEIGSGNSTLLFRHAIRDGGMKTQLTSVDPNPRRDIEPFSDKIIRQRVEEIASADLFTQLQAGDFLFIDSSHEIKSGNDVLHLFFKVLPMLAPGVVLHIHDVFLPYDYPKSWVVNQRWNWTEQYLVQALLQGSREFHVLWPGYYLQRTLPNFGSHFKFWSGSDARSLWLRRVAQ